jgi:hypothetical protein
MEYNLFNNTICNGCLHLERNPTDFGLMFNCSLEIDRHLYALIECNDYINEKLYLRKQKIDKITK